jgi:AraC-like DNA-binding protein
MLAAHLAPPPQDMGSSYQELLDELRFERAKQMLCEDQLPIYRIAETWVSAKPRAFAMPSCAGVACRPASFGHEPSGSSAP